MSEIKGQILGILLTIAVFTCVFGVLTATAQKSARSVESKMNTSFNLTAPPDDESSFVD